MNAFSAIWVSAAAAIALTACASPGNKEDSGKKTEGPKLVGRIAAIPADKRFVLIQGYGKWNIEAGTILTTRGGNERTANLLATGETLGQFAAADLQSGTVEMGDAVYSQHAPKPAQPSTELGITPESPDAQPDIGSQNVKKIINFSRILFFQNDQQPCIFKKSRPAQALELKIIEF